MQESTEEPEYVLSYTHRDMVHLPDPSSDDEYATKCRQDTTAVRLCRKYRPDSYPDYWTRCKKCFENAYGVGTVGEDAEGEVVCETFTQAQTGKLHIVGTSFPGSLYRCYCGLTRYSEPEERVVSLEDDGLCRMCAENHFEKLSE